MSSRLEELRTIMRRLRSADGCPWDREQTFASIAPYTIEEAYEVADAIERERLGGFTAQIERGRGGILHAPGEFVAIDERFQFAVAGFLAQLFGIQIAQQVEVERTGLNALHPTGANTTEMRLGGAGFEIPKHFLLAK